MKRILIMGLPGAGKTTLAIALKEELDSRGFKTIWLNADRVREEYNDWDFSHEGRIRQSKRMREMSSRIESDFVIADFVCPLQEMRDIYNADFTIWVDTIAEGRFPDTNQIFFAPTKFDLRVLTKDTFRWLPVILEQLVSFYKHQTVQELTHPNNDQ
jgi:adenylylsulfate kinase